MQQPDSVHLTQAVPSGDLQTALPGPFDEVCQDYAMSKYASSQDAREVMLVEIAALRACKTKLLAALNRIEWHAASEATSEGLEDAQADLRRIYDEARAAIRKATTE